MLAWSLVQTNHDVTTRLMFIRPIFRQFSDNVWLKSRHPHDFICYSYVPKKYDLPGFTMKYLHFSLDFPWFRGFPSMIPVPEVRLPRTLAILKLRQTAVVLSISTGGHGMPCNDSALYQQQTSNDKHTTSYESHHTHDLIKSQYHIYHSCQQLRSQGIHFPRQDQSSLWSDL